MSIQQMNESGVSLGDWAKRPQTPQQARTFTLVWKIKALLEALGRYHRRRASAVGIQQVVVQTNEGPSTVLVGNPSVVVQAFAGTSGIQGDCTQLATNS